MHSLSSWFRGIKGRLFFAACLPVVGFVLVFSVSNNGVKKLSSMIDSAHKEIIPNLDAIGEMRQSRNKFGYEAWNEINASSKEQKEKFSKSAHAAIKEFEDAYKDYADNTFMPEEAKMWEKLKDIYPQFIKHMQNTEDLIDAGTPEKLAEAKNLLLVDIPVMSDKIRDFNQAVIKMYYDRAKEEATQSVDTEKYVFNMLMLITLLASALTMAVVLWISSRISNSVSKIADNLTASSHQVTTSVAQLTEAGNSLSQSSTEAAASLEETVASLEEMSSMVKMNSDNAKQAAALSTTSRDSAEHGEREIQNLIQSMQGISTSSKKIEEIISVIDDIAFQTNLLALNAAVEAARAGEQGKGFAVVAEAVRALAQRSASSAKDISSLIKDSVSQIDNGSRIANQSGTVLANIVTSIKKVSDLNNEIAAASSEQTTGIQQINKAMNQLDQSSQSNAASAEEIAATSSEINSLASTTQQLTVSLNALILGNSHTSHESPPHHEPVRATAHAAAATKAPGKTTANFKLKKTPANVHPLRPRAQVKKSLATDMIPFDEDTRSKVGTTDGF